jgi:hypothetical protein
MLGLAFLANALAFAVALWRVVLMDHPAQASAGAWDQVDLLGSLAALAQVGSLLVCGVLFVVWLYRAHRSDRMDSRMLKHGSGWAIGAWFVPILNLWRPRQMVLDVRRGAWPQDTSPLVTLWWLTFLAMTVSSRISNARYPNAGGDTLAVLAELRRSAIFDAVYAATATVAAILAIMVVRSTSRLVAESALGRR